MKTFKKGTAWMLVLCLALSLTLSVAPVAAEGEAAVSAVDPYVYYFTPDVANIPDYYERYARPYMLYSGHSVHHHAHDEGGYFLVRFFNVVNMAALIEDEAEAPSGGYATTGAFCADAETNIQFGAAYRRLNLEDGYFNTNPDTVEGTIDARKIRAVLRNSMPNLDDLPALEKKINAYLTATYGQEAVPVSGLTGSQLISATQSAIWHYSNGFDFGTPYPYHDSDDFASWSEETIASKSAEVSYPDYPTSFMDIANDTTATNINGVYQYLLSLPGEDPKERVITADAVSLADAAVSGSGDDCSLTVLIHIDGTINGDDQLVLSVKCGDQTKTFSLGTTNTLEKLDNGLYAVSFAGVSEEDCTAVELILSGEQIIDDVCFFESKPTEETDARKTSQNMAGYGEGPAPVYSAATVNALSNASVLEITKVDEQSGNPLSGVAFDLYRKVEGDDLQVGSYITDADGKISVSVTDSEAYYFVETEALAGYAPVNGKLEAGEIPNSWNAGSLQVSKKLINETPAQVGETFDFKLTLDLSTAPVMGNGISWMTDAYIMEQLSCSKELDWTVSGEKELTATFTLNADETVTVDSIPLGATYTLEEVMTAEDRQWFTVTTKVDGKTVQKGNTSTGTVAARNAVLFTNSVVTGPELNLGSLEVSKKLINTTPAQVGETFNFEITLDFSAADVYKNGAPWMNDEYLLGKVTCDENLTWTEKDGLYTATFTVDADETVTVNGLACGTVYTVREVLTAEDRQWFNVTSQVDGEQERYSDTAAGSVAAQNGVLFTNSVVTADVQLGELAVSKKLINTTPAQVGETFNFEITLDFSTADIYTDDIPWMNNEYLLGKVSCDEKLTWTEKDGRYTATFTVDADETVTVRGLAYGTTYTVEEVLTAEDRQWFNVTSKVCNEDTRNSETAEGSIAEVNAILFTNSVVTADVKLGDLEISKKLINTTPAEVGETFNFRITLDFSTADIYTNAIPWMNDEYLLDFVSSTENLSWTEENGIYTAAFTVDADETVTIGGVALGTTFTVEEILTEEDRQWFESTSQIGSSVAGSVAQSTVAEKNAVLFTNSVVTGPVLVTGSVEVSKKLVNTTPAQVGETFSFQITLDLSTADVYTNAAPWMNDEYLMGFVTGTEALTWTEEDGKYTAAFTVNADDTFSINGIAQGASYTVREILTEEDRQWFNVTSQIGHEEAKNADTVASTVAENNAVVFTNSVVTTDVELGSVEVSKALVNTTPAKVGETFNFRITLDLSTADVYTNPVPWMNDEYLMGFVTGTEALTWTEEDGKYVADFTVNAAQTVSIDGIAHGTTYTVQEILTEEDRKWFTVTSQIGDEEVKDSDTVESTVAEENALLFTNTVVTGIELTTGTLEATKKLVNAPEAKANERFTFRITLDLSTADIYQDPAPWMYDEYLLDQIEGSRELTWTKVGQKKYAATFTLKAGETIAINGIAQSTGYTLEEVLTKEERSIYRVTTEVITNGGAPVEEKISLVTGTVAQENTVVFTNEYVEKIPVTDDYSMVTPMILCLVSILVAGALILNKRRFIG